MSDNPIVSEAMIEAGAQAYHRSDPLRIDCDERRDAMLFAIYTAMHSARAHPTDEEEVERRRGQEEGFAAAVQWLRDRAAIKPPASLWHAAQLLADQLEQSRIPGKDTQGDKG